MAKSSVDYSERLDALWDFEHPAESEARFRAEPHAIGRDRAKRSEAHPGRARAGAAAKFTDADRTSTACTHARHSRCACASATCWTRPPWTIRPARAPAVAGSSRRSPRRQRLAGGAAYYRVDALHMLAIASPPASIDFHRRAIAAAETATTYARAAGARRCCTTSAGRCDDRGDDAAALDYWRQAPPAMREAANDVPRARIARWTVARGLRALGELDEAEAMQRALADELQAANAPDGYVFEELAEIAVARGDRAAAQPWAAKALQLLGDDADMKANEPARLARLAELAQPVTRRRPAADPKRRPRRRRCFARQRLEPH